MPRPETRTKRTFTRLARRLCYGSESDHSEQSARDVGGMGGWVGQGKTRLYVRSGVGQGWPGRISKYLKTFFCAPCVNAELCIRIHLDIIDKNL